MERNIKMIVEKIKQPSTTINNINNINNINKTISKTIDKVKTRKINDNIWTSSINNKWIVGALLIFALFIIFIAFRMIRNRKIKIDK